ncbi:dynein axonemal assembly factor 4-like isoform X2 [Antennarius striatus]|uniref:dynein axonemal assembly factor 4-like isoform X2 n=1 Tax=Antennarius striatus TaxID=241820 RepID=UPI0035B225D5
MPLMVSDYSWTQTESTVCISVDLKGHRADRVDVVSTDEYLKVHFPPYLFEAFLFQPVDDVRGTAKVGNGVACFSLPKKIQGMWEQLMITTYDKVQQREVRERAVVKYQEKLSSQSTSKAAQKQAERRYGLETLMKLEQEERDAVQKVKDAEREKTRAELEAWQLRPETGASEEAQRQVRRQSHAPAPPDPPTEKQSAGRPEELPAQRPSGNIPVRFTTRVFPTPLRESRAAEEEEWSRKQAEARRAGDPDAVELGGLTEKELRADWLKDKGDQCFVSGDYLGAVNAYSLALRLHRDIPALYSNRAACHLKLRNLHKAIEDSSQALVLLTPPVAANAASRSRAHVRRGSAFCQLQLYAEGLQDYQAALRIQPDDEALQADTQTIRDAIQGPPARLDTQ